MNDGCADRRDFLRLLDGELTENRAVALREHAGRCPYCQQELATLRALVGRIAAPPPPGADPEGSLDALMSRVLASPHSPVPRRRWSSRVWAVGVALAAASVLLVVDRREPLSERGRFDARGGAVAPNRKAWAELWALDGPPRKLGPASNVARSTPLVASYSNVDTAPAYLLAFALDEAGETHWLYPAFLDPGTDPASLRMEPSTVQHALPDSVALDELLPGPARFVFVISPTPLRVSDVERIPAAERTPEALRRRWPDAWVDVIPARVGPPSSSSHP